LRASENTLQIYFLVAKRSVFVLYLHGDNRAAARDLKRGQFPAQPLQPAFGRDEELFIGAAQDDIGIGEQPRGKAPEIPLGARIRPRPKDDVETFLLRDADKCGGIARAAEVIDSRLALVHIPKDVSRDCVQAHSARLLEAISPVFARDALIMQFARDDL
jgi:hypothetical protein